MVLFFSITLSATNGNWVWPSTGVCALKVVVSLHTLKFAPLPGLGIKQLPKKFFLTRFVFSYSFFIFPKVCYEGVYESLAL